LISEVLQVFRWIDAQAPTTAQHRVNLPHALNGLGMADEEEALLANGKCLVKHLYASGIFVIA
jgi:hypothetical protein